MIIAILDLFLVFQNQSTYDSGDSILHFLYSKQSFHYPKYFMNHWAKPVFVLLSSPFAFFGWNGMKLFNGLCILGSSFFLFKIFEEFQFKKWLAVVFCFAAPHFFLVQSSGLTEPLFTLFLTAIVYCFLRSKYIFALSLLSFLPFIRSEGWIIMVVVLPFLIQNKKMRFAPYILVGTLAYGIVGLIYYQDFLWMFHQNPYSGTELKYGNGNYIHFINQLPYVIGFPLYILVFIGYWDGFQRSLRGMIRSEEFFLVYGISLAYFIAHTIFWAEGLFHSFGMKRVLIVLIPLYGFIAYRGIERIICALGGRWHKGVWYFFTALLAIFPFTSNKSGLNLPQSVKKEPLQVMIDEIFAENFDLISDNRIYYGNTYIPLAFNKDIDQVNDALRIGLLHQYEPLDNSLVIWDSYFAPTDQNMEADQLDDHPDLEFINEYGCKECAKPYYIRIYRTK